MEQVQEQKKAEGFESVCGAGTAAVFEELQQLHERGLIQSEVVSNLTSQENRRRWNI